MRKKSKKGKDIRPIVYIVGLILIIGGLYLWKYEKPQESKMVFVENEKPGKEQLFVPIKKDVAIKLFANPVIVTDVNLSVKANEDILEINGKELETILDLISMRSKTMWKGLQEIDSKLSISEDHRTLKLGIYKDEKLNMSYVNVPAGFLRAYIK
jgi:hypothetical protein